MKLSVVRAIPLCMIVAIATLALSGVPRFKNAHHGADALVGEASWLCFVLAALTTIVLVAVVAHRRRTGLDSTAARS